MLCRTAERKIIMAVRTNKQNAPAKETKGAKKNTGHSCGFTMTGTLESVYVGKMYAFATIRVDKDNGYYDKFKIAYPLETDFPDDGATVSAAGNMTLYKNEPSLDGTMITEVDPF